MSETDQAENCSTCKFYHHDSAYGWGGRFECRRYPPQVISGNTEFPHPRYHEWCGEFIPAQPYEAQAVTPHSVDTPLE